MNLPYGFVVSGRLTFSSRILIGLCLCLSISGCMHSRHYAVVSAKDLGFPIVTRNCYKLVGYVSDKSSSYLSEEEIARSAGLAVKRYQKDFEQCLPDVFRNDGLPFVLHEVDSGSQTSFPLPIPVVMPVIVPQMTSTKGFAEYHIEIEQPDSKVVTSLRNAFIYSNSLSPWPVAFLCYNGVPDLPEGQSPEDYASRKHINSFLGKSLSSSVTPAHPNFSLLAYGIAVKLKELEDAGRVSAIGFERQKTPYRIIGCERKSGNGFSYEFSLEMVGGEGSLRAFRNVQKEFRDVIKADYLQAFPDTDDRSVVVDFPEYQLDEGRIKGRAVVLLIDITALTYDPDTRRGMIAIRIRPNQFEEARKWARANIESLVREKNVALSAGKVPDGAHYHLGREELKDGDILEIEFRAE